MSGPGLEIVITGGNGLPAPGGCLKSTFAAKFSCLWVFVLENESNVLVLGVFSERVSGVKGAGSNSDGALGVAGNSVPLGLRPKITMLSSIRWTFNFRSSTYLVWYE